VTLGANVNEKYPKVFNALNTHDPAILSKICREMRFSLSSIGDNCLVVSRSTLLIDEKLSSNFPKIFINFMYKSDANLN
jgi:hypothetical protein